MPVPSAITDMSTTPGSNSPAVSESVSTMDDYLRTLSAFIRQNYDSIAAASSNATSALANIIPRAAGGGTVDIITATYSPAVALTNGTTVLLEAAGANTSTTPTFAPNGLTAKTIVKGSGTALVAGDIPGANAWLLLTYNSSLDKWVLLNPGFAQVAGQVAAAYKNLASSASGTSASVLVSADQIAVENASNQLLTLRTVSLTINSAASGANGLDTGSIAASTWYSVWVIYNPATATTAGLLSTSATAPTMPSGYTFKARLGWMRTDATVNKYPLAFTQRNNRVQYKVGAGTNVTDLPTMASGTPGITLVPISVSNFVPTTASSIKVLADLPNSNFLKINVNSYPNSSAGSYNAPAGGASLIPIELILESTNIYWSTTASSSVKAIGWEDNL